MIELESMAVEMPEVEGHPNRVGFRGVLTVVDAASERAPSGSKGHRVVLTRAAAEAGLASLVGMALDYAPAFDRHDQRRKVGVITSADVVGRNLQVGGYLYAKDFPEVVDEIARAGGRKADFRLWIPDLGPRSAGVRPQTPDLEPLAAGARLRRSLAAAVEGVRGIANSIRRSAGNGKAGNTLRAEARVSLSCRNGEIHRQRQGKLRHAIAARAAGLGMSFEVSDVTVMDLRARVWVLTHVTFTGAAILRRDKAAYADTWIELS